MPVIGYAPVEMLAARVSDGFVAVATHGSGIFSAKVDPDAINSIAGSPELPSTFQLSQNHPNPFNSNTTIGFSLNVESHVAIRIFNLRGQLIRTLVDRKVEPGTKTVQWDGKNDAGASVNSGVYFYQLKAADFLQTEKMTLLR